MVSLQLWQFWNFLKDFCGADWVLLLAQSALQNGSIQDGCSHCRHPFPYPGTSLCCFHLWKLYVASDTPALLLVTKMDCRHLLSVPVIGFCIRGHLVHRLEGGCNLAPKFISEW